MSRGVLVTGLPRSGTSWVGKMLEASGQLVYVNEPMNPSHPPGRSPGVLDAEVGHYFHYICADNEPPWVRAFGDTLRLRYKPVAELRRNHTPYDVARALKYGAAFSLGRARRRAALLDDPYALLSAGWFVQRLGVRSLVLVRHPVSFVGSWKKLDWRVDATELLDQPLLMRDHLEPLRAELEAEVDSADWLASACVLWKAAYTVVHAVAAAHPDLVVRTYESLAGDPLVAFEALYGDLGLRWGDAPAATVGAATSTTPRESTGFRWSLRGGLSRTAFQPMDSRASVAAAAGRLSPPEVERVLALTDPVRGLFYQD